MNDEYLWDKSGEPDPEVQQLEEVLGSLKYQSRPFEIPRGLLVVRRRRYLPPIAIAASLVFALLAAGFWLLRMQNRNEQPTNQAEVEQPVPVPESTIRRRDAQPVGEKKEAPAVAVHRPNRPKSSTVRNIGQKLTEREREEAMAVKQQLLVALRLASEKLNLAQKKTLNPSAPGQIRNQHKVG